MVHMALFHPKVQRIWQAPPIPPEMSGMQSLIFVARVWSTSRALKCQGLNSASLLKKMLRCGELLECQTHRFLSNKHLEPPDAGPNTDSAAHQSIDQESPGYSEQVASNPKKRKHNQGDNQEDSIQNLTDQRDASDDEEPLVPQPCEEETETEEEEQQQEPTSCTSNITGTADCEIDASSWQRLSDSIGSSWKSIIDSTNGKEEDPIVDFLCKSQETMHEILSKYPVEQLETTTGKLLKSFSNGIMAYEVIYPQRKKADQNFFLSLLGVRTILCCETSREVCLGHHYRGNFWRFRGSKAVPGKGNSEDDEEWRMSSREPLSRPNADPYARIVMITAGFSIYDALLHYPIQQLDAATSKVIHSHIDGFAALAKATPSLECEFDLFYSLLGIRKEKDSEGNDTVVGHHYKGSFWRFRGSKASPTDKQPRTEYHHALQSPYSYAQTAPPPGQGPIYSYFRSNVAPYPSGPNGIPPSNPYYYP